MGEVDYRPFRPGDVDETNPHLQDFRGKMNKRRELERTKRMQEQLKNAET